MSCPTCDTELIPVKLGTVAYWCTECERYVQPKAELKVTH